MGIEKSVRGDLLKERAAALTPFKSTIRVLGWAYSIRDSSRTLASVSTIILSSRTLPACPMSITSAQSGLDETTTPMIFQSVVQPAMHCGGRSSTRYLSGKELRLSGRSGRQSMVASSITTALCGAVPPRFSSSLPSPPSRLEGQITQAVGRSQKEGDFRAAGVLYATAHIPLRH